MDEWDGKILDRTFYNMPFIEETDPGVRKDAGNPRFYACKVHPHYISSNKFQVGMFWTVVSWRHPWTNSTVY